MQPDQRKFWYHLRRKRQNQNKRDAAEREKTAVAAWWVFIARRSLAALADGSKPGPQHMDFDRAYKTLMRSDPVFSFAASLVDPNITPYPEWRRRVCQIAKELLLAKPLDAT